MTKVVKEKEAPKKSFSWFTFVSGCAIGCCVGSLAATFITKSIYAPIVDASLALNSMGGTTQVDGGSDAESEQPEVTPAPTETPNYQTDIKEHTVTPEDGTSFTFYTPTDWYSLTDQYLDSLDTYYANTLPRDNAVCVGNNPDQYSSTAVINVRPLSSIEATLEAIYGDEYNEDEMLYGDAYTFLQTGEVSEDAAENGVTVELIDTWTVNDVEFSVLLLGYDTEYLVDGESEETTTVRTEEIVCYSSTEDTLELILYMQEFDRDAGIQYVKEFLGVEQD